MNKEKKMKKIQDKKKKKKERKKRNLSDSYLYEEEYSVSSNCTIDYYNDNDRFLGSRDKMGMFGNIDKFDRM